MLIRPVRFAQSLYSGEQTMSPGLLSLVMVAIHIPLAVGMRSAQPLVALHAFVTVGVALAAAISGRRPDRVAACAAYITGAEVLWRMTDADLPWELGKYSVVLIFLVWMVRARAYRTLKYPGLVFCLLLPSSVLSFQELGLTVAQDQLSFNLSGPLSLAISAAFFMNLKLSPRQFQGVLLALIGPVCGIATVAFVGIVTNANIQFTTESNFQLSGGFGPNQVSAALGLAVLCSFLLVIETQSRIAFRLVMFAVMVWLAVQSALTFSRGGLYTAAAGTLAAWLALIDQPKALLKPLMVAVALFVLGNYVIWPKLDEFTEGNLTARFEDTGTTRRGDLSNTDLQLFLDHPVFGVGPGVSKEAHGEAIAAHTEFTRLIAEHGLFGATVILALFAAGFFNFKAAASSRERAIVLSMAAWSTLFMLNSAMRLVAPSLGFGLTFATMLPVAAKAKGIPSLLLNKRQPRLLRPTG